MQFARLFVANFLHKAHVLGFVKSVSVLCTVLYMSMFVHATCFISLIKGLRSQAYKRLLMGYSGSFLTDFPLRVSDDWLFAIFTLPRSDMRHMVSRHRLILSSERVAGMGGREATNWKLCGKNKPGLSDFCSDWHEKGKQTINVSRRLLITKLLKTNMMSEMCGGRVIGGFVCEGFDGSMTLFEIVDVICDGAHWDSREDNLHSLVRWGGQHFTLYLRLALHKVLVRPIKSVSVVIDNVLKYFHHHHLTTWKPSINMSRVVVVIGPILWSLSKKCSISGHNVL